MSIDEVGQIVQVVVDAPQRADVVVVTLALQPSSGDGEICVYIMGGGNGRYGKSFTHSVAVFSRLSTKETYFLAIFELGGCSIFG